VQAFDISCHLCVCAPLRVKYGGDGGDSGVLLVMLQGSDQSAHQKWAQDGS
jgi:hypothetical protein